MKNDISKSICKALIFTVLPFAIPLIFEIIPNTFINNAGKIIIVLLLFAIDTYFVFKITVRDCKELNDAKNIIDTNKRFYISRKVLDRIANCEKIKGEFIKDETNKLHYNYKENILLYNPHRYLERVCDELKTLVSDITHIDFLEKTLGYIPKKICCRYNPGGLFKISTDIMDNPGDAKYGFTTEQMFEGYKILKAKGVENFGIHSFLASNTVTNDYYPTLARELFELAVKLKEETGAHITFINLSGGIGIPYRPDQEPNDIRAIGEGVRKVYEEVLVPAGMGDVAIYTELGRYMMAPYGHLVTQVIHEKHTHKEYIGVDACAVNLMRPAMYGAYHHITVLGKENEPCDHKYDVTGSLCENNDKFAIDRMLPKIDIGDYIAIHDTGAHGFAMGYNYNGKLKSAELLLKEDGSVEMIRRAETPRDYFATFDCFDIYNKIDFDA